MKHPIASPGAIALSSTLAVGALLGLSHPASASVFRATNGGAACKPALSNSTSFLFNNKYAENTNTTDQYLICHLVMADLSTGPPPPQQLTIWFKAGATGGTALCLVQAGYYLDSTITSASVFSSGTAAAGGLVAVSWFEPGLVRSTSNHALTLNCKVPAGWRMGLIQYATSD